MSTPAARVRRERNALESLLSIVLVLEAVLVFFVSLAVYGLRVVPIGVAFGGGAAFVVVLVIASRLQRYDWGVWLGWVLQAALIATGFLLTLMFFIGAGFLGLWIYCFVTGRRLERRKAEYLASHPNPNL